MSFADKKQMLSDVEIGFFLSGGLDSSLITVLAKNNVVVNEVECYQTILTPRKIEEKYNGVLFFSQTGIESYLKENLWV